MSIPAAFDELVDALDPPTPTGFTVTDEATADWALARIGKHRREHAAVVAVVDAKLERLSEFRKAADQRLDVETSWLCEQVEGWHRRVLDSDERRKTIKLTEGELHARKSPATVNVTDEPAFVAWAKAWAPDLLRVTVAPDKPAIKRLGHADAAVVAVDGERVPGVEWVAGEVRYSVVTE